MVLTEGGKLIHKTASLLRVQEFLFVGVIRQTFEEISTVKQNNQQELNDFYTTRLATATHMNAYLLVRKLMIVTCILIIN